MRLAEIATTMNIYGTAMMDSKREASCYPRARKNEKAVIGFDQTRMSSIIVATTDLAYGIEALKKM